jgi:phosphoribosylformylglycinamidine synthase
MTAKDWKDSLKGAVNLSEAQRVVLCMRAAALPGEELSYDSASGVMDGAVRGLTEEKVKPVACLDALHIGSLKNKSTRDRFQSAVDGMAAYGARAGIPIMGGEAYFHPCYDESALIHILGIGIPAAGAADGTPAELLTVPETTAEAVPAVPAAEAEAGDGTPAEEPLHLVQAKEYDVAGLPEPKEYGQVLQALLSTPSISGKGYIYRQFDPAAEPSAVMGPGESGAAVLRLGDGTGVAATMDGNPRYARLDARLGGVIAVCEAARNLVCVGAKPAGALAAVYTYGSDGPKARGGLLEAAQALAIPLEVQFRSLSETDWKEMYPTPVVGMLGVLESPDRAVRGGFRQEGDVVILLGRNKDELGASVYLSVIHGLEAGRPPELDLRLEKSVQDVTLELIQAGLAVSAHDCAEGGLAVALAESCVTGNIGVEITLTEAMRPSGFLFGETQSRIIISTKKEWAERTLSYLAKARIPYQVVGVVGGNKLRITGSDYHLILSLLELEEKYRRHIECVMNS